MSILQDQRIIITGATGGIGSEVVKQLAQQDCKLVLVGRNHNKLDELAKELNLPDERLMCIAADINQSEGREMIVQHTKKIFGGYDMLINTAGLMDFTSFLDQPDERIEAVFNTNVIAPILLCKKVLPDMIAQNKGHIVNVGSVFGSIGFAWFTTYSSTKFALRGFSQALRRELAETPIKISYIAPRAVRTSLNSGAVYNMAKKTNMNMDDPTKVAQKIVRSILKSDNEKYIGFPESLFVRINAVFPGIVDKVTRGQHKQAKEFI